MRNVPYGVIFFGVILVLTSVWQIYYIPHFTRYQTVNPGVPHTLMLFRYVVSYLLRMTGLACGIGVIFYLNVYRKVLIGILIFSIATLPLRHTYASFYYFVKPLFHGPVTSLVSLEMFTWINVLFRWAVDGSFAACGIYYFTRPGVIVHFKQRS